MNVAVGSPVHLTPVETYPAYESVLASLELRSMVDDALAEALRCIPDQPPYYAAGILAAHGLPALGRDFVEMSERVSALYAAAHQRCISRTDAGADLTPEELAAIEAYLEAAWQLRPIRELVLRVADAGATLDFAFAP